MNQNNVLERDKAKSQENAPDSETAVSRNRHSGAKINPPAATGGLEKTQTGLAQTGIDFATAFLAGIQARFRVNEVVELSERIYQARVRREPSPLKPEERKNDIMIFCEAFEVYQSSWAHVVRRHFKDLTGQHFEDFETAIEVLGEELYDNAERPGPIVTMVTPATFAEELAE